METRLDPSQGRSFAGRCVAGWARTADWLGGHRPLDLILGACAIIAAVAAVAQN